MREQVKISERQIVAGQEQFRQSQKQLQETLEVSQRPYVIPTGSLELEVFGTRKRFAFERTDPGQTVTLKNGGAGIALNIYGVLVQPRPENETALHVRPDARSLVLDVPLPAGEEITVSTSAVSVYGWDTIIGNDVRSTLAPRQEQDPRLAYVVVARLTLTYEDMFGNTHGIQFDYLETDRWVYLRHLPKINRGLDTLGYELAQSMLRSQTALQAELAAERLKRGDV